MAMEQNAQTKVQTNQKRTNKGRCRIKRLENSTEEVEERGKEGCVTIQNRMKS